MLGTYVWPSYVCIDEKVPIFPVNKVSQRNTLYFVSNGYIMSERSREQGARAEAQKIPIETANEAFQDQLIDYKDVL